MTNEIKTLDDALLVFQKDFEGINKDRENTFTNSRYANLDDVWNAAQPILSGLNLLAKNSISIGGDKTILTCTISLVGSEESITSSAYIDDDKGAQIFGSELSYKKRYLLCTMLNIVENNDDDGNAGADSPMATLTETQHSEIVDLIEATETKSDKFSAYLMDVYKVDDVENLTIRQASIVRNQLRAKHKRLQNAKN